MTTCYRLLSGALPALPDAASQLVRRLDKTSWPALPADDRPTFGVPAVVIQQHVESWAHWLQQDPEPPMGRHEHVTVAGGEVHVVRFEGTGRVPMVLLHGWPTSFLAFHRVLEPLLDLASEVVLATLPGFGASPMPTRGLLVDVLADLMLDAMSRLGHERLLVHGQDWGSAVAREMGLRAPDRVIGVHVSAGLHGFLADGPDSGAAWDRLRQFAIEGAGYLQLQSRRPNALAIALADSPAGLLAWQLDKYQLWQSSLGPDFGLGEDFIFANATLYWATNSIGSSMRIYAANRSTTALRPSPTATGVSVFGAGDFTARPSRRERTTLSPGTNTKLEDTWPRSTRHPSSSRICPTS